MFNKEVVLSTGSIVLNRDLHISRNSLIASRVIAIRAMLETDGNKKEDEQLLDVANNIHLRAQQENCSQEDKDLSFQLFNQESIIWAENSGYNSLLDDSNQSQRIEAYKQSWLFVLNPPKLPNFKSRDQLAEEEVNRRYPSGNYILDNIARPSKGIAGGATGTPTKDQIITRYKEDTNIIHRYYDQFSNYIDQNLDRFTELKVRRHLDKIEWGDRNHPLQILWKINNIKEMVPRKGGRLGRGVGITPPFNVNNLFSGNAYIFKSDDAIL